jgi:hypothetical protein
MARKHAPDFDLEIEAPANGRLRQSTIRVIHRGDDRALFTDTADLNRAKERAKATARIAEHLKVSPSKVAPRLEEAWNNITDQHRRLCAQAAAGSPEAAPVMTVDLLDAQLDEVRRPLCLVGGTAFAAAWCKVRLATSRCVDAAGRVVEHDPPLVAIEDRLVVVRGDGAAFADGGLVPGARPLADLGLPVRLPHSPPPSCGWSGAGVKRYLAGERPDPAEVFARLQGVVDRFMDFARSLADQQTTCELVACYVLATWLLDAFHVVGYLWPNGERGCGKTSFLQVVTETAYLGQLILAGSSYPTLRDLADYGATLAFDDAEAVMDTRRTDPDKRTLLLAGNRRGATIAVKELEGERWVTRHVRTFSPRLFSAIRLPDPVLGSRSIVLPLVRSSDPARSKASVMDDANWPGDRRRLRDDCWALALANLPDLPEHDRTAAVRARLAGRDLEPWRAILAVAHWLEHRHGVTGLFGRMEALSMDYQKNERGEIEEHDSTRVLFRALLELTREIGEDEVLEVSPSRVAETMNRIAKDEDLADADKDFTNARRVGWLLKRQRFRKAEADAHGKRWALPRHDVVAAAKAYGVEDMGGENPAADTPF